MSQVQNENRKKELTAQVNKFATKVAIIATPVVLATSAFAEESNSIEMGTLGIVGLSTAAATIFAIKAAPSLMMWGYRKVLGFVGR